MFFWFFWDVVVDIRFLFVFQDGCFLYLRGGFDLAIDFGDSDGNWVVKSCSFRVDVRMRSGCDD